jgi:hypothetical protein
LNAITIELDRRRQLDEGNVVGEGVGVPVGVEVGVGGLDDDAVGLARLGDVVAAGVHFPAEADKEGGAIRNISIIYEQLQGLVRELKIFWLLIIFRHSIVKILF